LHHSPALSPIARRARHPYSLAVVMCIEKYGVFVDRVCQQ
jgi:hypothetical protein